MDLRTAALAQTIENYKKLFNGFLSFLKSPAAARWYLLVLAAAFLYYVLSLSWISIISQLNFSTSAYDVGLYDQEVWRVSRFLSPFSTIKGVNLLGDHAAFYPLLLVPVYWVWANINVLYIAQSFFLALAVFPLFFYARGRLKSSYLALAIGLSFLLYPALNNMNLENFHPEVMVVFPLMCAVYFMMKGNFRLFYPFMIISLLAKEDIGITVFFMGLYLWFFKKEQRHGIITLAAGLGWYLFCSRFLMPVFNGISIFSSQPVFYSAWFQGAGRNLFNPFFYLVRVLNGEALIYYRDLLQPVIFLPVLSPAMLFMLFPSLLINLLSGSPYLSSTYYHYNYVTVVFVYFALVEGVLLLRRITFKRDFARRSFFLALGLLLVFSGYQHNKYLSRVPLSRQWNIIRQSRANIFSRKNQARKKAVELVPPAAKVSATHSLVPHLTHREFIFMFPNPYRATLWNMWFVEGKGLPPIGGEIDYLALDLAESTPENSMIAAFLQRSSNYREIFNEERVVVLKRAEAREEENQGANFVVYDLTEPLSIIDDFSEKLKVRGNGIFSMLYFPGSKYYFRNLMGEEIPSREKFALEIFGYLFIPESGKYRFKLISAGRSLLEVDGRPFAGEVYLDQGFHSYRIKYIDSGSSYGLRFSIVPPRGAEYIIPDRELLRRYAPAQFRGLLRRFDNKRKSRLEFMRRQPNRVVNGGFEKAYGNFPRDWKLVQWEGEETATACSVDKRIKKKGRLSARLEHDGPADSRWVQEVEVEPDTYYKLSGWIRVVGVGREGKGASLQTVGMNLETAPLYGTMGWRYVEARGKTGADQEKVKVLCRLGNYGAPVSGTAYFDDIELKKQSPDHE